MEKRLEVNLTQFKSLLELTSATFVPKMVRETCLRQTKSPNYDQSVIENLELGV